MHLYLDKPALKICEKCGRPAKPHMVCPSCGFYKGREVVDVLSKLDRRSRRAREAEMAAREAEKKSANVAEK
jgi:large subunit ribosomal protein L32